MGNDNFDDLHPADNYEPSEEELRELNEILNKEEEQKEFLQEFRDVKVKNRIFFTYSTESHWAGWLRIHGIKW